MNQQNKVTKVTKVTNALILAAGTGSRLGKYTKDNTKCMLEVNDKTIINQALEKLNNVGITSLTLVVGYKAENLIEHVGHKFKNITINYIHNNIYNTTNNIYSLYLAKNILEENDTILLESDLIFDEEILSDLINDKRPNLAVVDKYQSWMDGTSVEINDDNEILNIYDKKSFNFANVDNYYKTVNIYKFSKEFSSNIYIPFLEAYLKVKGQNEYYESVLKVIIADNSDLKAKVLNGQKWYEIDDIQDKQNAEIIFASDISTKLSLIQKRYGGYWKFPDIKDFCYLVNPYFPNKKYLDEMTKYFYDLLSQYPSGQSTQNTLASKMFNIEQENILVANGAAEIIKNLNTVKAINGTFGIMLPTFNEYTNAIGHDRCIKENKIDGYTTNDLIQLLNKSDNLILVNPDNPSGQLTNREDIIKLLDIAKTQNKNIILDESFLDFANGENLSLLSQDIIDKYNNLIIIKSISKSYGVPGLRLGVVITSNLEILKDLNSKMSIWNINSFAEYFLQTIGKYKNDYKLACDKIKKERNTLYKRLSEISFLDVRESNANYFLCKVNFNSTELTKLLLAKNLYIKDLKNNDGFNNENYIRIAVRDEIDNNKLISVLKELDIN